jgi:hypothetical protein
MQDVVMSDVPPENIDVIFEECGKNLNTVSSLLV